MLNSQNSSRKTLIKELETHQNDINFVNMGFSNIQSFSKTKPNNLQFALNDDIEVSQFGRDRDNSNDKYQKGFGSFGEKLRIKSPAKSPQKGSFLNNNESNANSRFLRPLFDDAPNCSSMHGVIDDNSNNIEHKFMFGNDKMSRLEENHSMSLMFRNQNSNSFMMYQGTPK